MLQNFFHHLPFFIILIGVLVFIHEAGHFLFAKLFKVKVHVFSLGFGPKLLGFQKGETLYKISAFPIGGYVKMLGEDPEEEVYSEDKGRAFGDKPCWQRFIIVAAGPVMNMVLAFFIYFGLGLTFDEVVPATVGQVNENMPAAKAGLLPNDVIESIDDVSVNSWDHLLYIMASKQDEDVNLVIKRGTKKISKKVPTERIETLLWGIPGANEERWIIGIQPFFRPTMIGIESKSSIAYLAGLRSFDIIESVNGKKIERMIDLESMLTQASGSRVTLAAKRLKKDAGKNPKKKSIQPSFENSHGEKPITIYLDIPNSTKSIHLLGIDSSEDFVAYVSKNSLAEKIGIMRGDRLLGIDGKKYRNNNIFTVLDKGKEESHEIEWLNEGTTKRGTFKHNFIPAGAAQDLGVKRDIYDRGFFGLKKSVLPPLIENKERLSEAYRYAVTHTWEVMKAVGIGFKLLFLGEISIQSMGGPIMIGQLAGQAAEAGLFVFLGLLAFISLNLGLVNLMPISVLDGGQIVFILIESITRRPLKPSIKEKLMLAGVIMILLLMVIVIRNDIARIFVE